MIFKAGDRVTVDCNTQLRYGVVDDVNEVDNLVVVLVTDEDNTIRAIECPSERVKLDYTQMKPSSHFNKHYQNLSVQPIRMMIRLFTREQMEGFLMGNIIKYTLRAGHKVGEDKEKDTNKANHYKEMLIQFKETGDITLEGE